MAERVLLTGGAGYIGSVLTGYLLKRGYEVVVLDNLLYSQTSLLQYCSSSNFSFIKGDARDKALLKSLIKDSDTIIALAAIVGMKACDSDPIMATTLNYDAVVELGNLCSKHQRILYPCTNSGYGTKSGDQFCTEETPLEPISLYGKTKVNAERELLKNENAISLRLATVFGPSSRMRLDLLVNDFVYRAVKDRFLIIYEPHFKRNYIYITDVAKCFCYCIENFDEMKGQAYNLGLDDANLSKAELALAIKEFIPFFYIHHAEVGTDPDKRNYIVSNEKLKNRGFVATTSLHEGIKHLIKAYEMMPRGNFFNG